MLHLPADHTSSREAEVTFLPASQAAGEPVEFRSVRFSCCVSAMLRGTARAVGFLRLKTPGMTIPPTVRHVVLLLVTSNTMLAMPFLQLHNLAARSRLSADSLVLCNPAVLLCGPTTDVPHRKTSECSSQG